MIISQKIADKSAIIGVVGLGYVGLPLAIAFARDGFRVVGFESDNSKKCALQQGISYVDDVENDLIAELIGTGAFSVTDDIRLLGEPDAICICVPTPLTKQREPVVSYVITAAQDLAVHLRKGQLVVLESSIYPGATREIVLPILEGSGLMVGEDYYLAFSPERVDPSNKKYCIRNTPKLVGGYDSESTRIACALYNNIVDQVVCMSSMEVAETTKLFENCFRLINIAFVNEFAELCERMGISIWEVIDSAKTKPFGYMPFYPGPGIGGHCIPINPYFLSWKAREKDFQVSFLDLATGINEKMPYSTATKIVEGLSMKGKSILASRILVLGVAYKKDIADSRESPSIRLIELLSQKGATVSYNDPFIEKIEISGDILESAEVSAEELSSYDCIVIATDHSSYDFQMIVDNSKMVFDTKGVTRFTENGHGNVLRLGETLCITRKVLKDQI